MMKYFLRQDKQATKVNNPENLHHKLLPVKDKMDENT